MGLKVDSIQYYLRSKDFFEVKYFLDIINMFFPRWSIAELSILPCHVAPGKYVRQLEQSIYV